MNASSPNTTSHYASMEHATTIKAPLTITYAKATIPGKKGYVCTQLPNLLINSNQKSVLQPSEARTTLLSICASFEQQNHKGHAHLEWALRSTLWFWDPWEWRVSPYLNFCMANGYTNMIKQLPMRVHYLVCPTRAPAYIAFMVMPNSHY